MENINNEQSVKAGENRSCFKNLINDGQVPFLCLSALVQWFQVLSLIPFCWVRTGSDLNLFKFFIHVYMTCNQKCM